MSVFKFQYHDWNLLTFPAPPLTIAHKQHLDCEGLDCYYCMTYKAIYSDSLLVFPYLGSFRSNMQMAKWYRSRVCPETGFCLYLSVVTMAWIGLPTYLIKIGALQGLRHQQGDTIMVPIWSCLIAEDASFTEPVAIYVLIRPSKVAIHCCHSNAWCWKMNMYGKPFVPLYYAWTHMNSFTCLCKLITRLCRLINCVCQLITRLHKLITRLWKLKTAMSTHYTSM